MEGVSEEVAKVHSPVIDSTSNATSVQHQSQNNTQQTEEETLDEINLDNDNQIVQSLSESEKGENCPIEKEEEKCEDAQIQVYENVEVVPLPALKENNEIEAIESPGKDIEQSPVENMDKPSVDENIESETVDLPAEEVEKVPDLALDNTMKCDEVETSEESPPEIEANATNNNNNGNSSPARIDVKPSEELDQVSSKLTGKRTVLVCESDTLDETFQRLKQGVQSKTLSSKEIINAVFHSLVGGPPDLESKFIIQDHLSVIKMVHLLDDCPQVMQAEMWSVFAAIARKTNRNLEACAQAGLVHLILERLTGATEVVGDLMVDLLGVLCTYSISVKQMKLMLRCLQADNQRWLLHSSKLLSVFRQMPKREGPDSFFSFSGNRASGIYLPPISKWPYQNGWTFATWLRMDPVNSVNFEKETPFVYCFRSNKGLGYSLHFMGNCLVVTAQVKQSKGFTRCIKQEIVPRKWHHVVISHVYSRWGKSEIQCYINGQLAETFEMPWLASTSDSFDRCYIGSGPDLSAESSFCGQLGAVYVFSECLSLQQVNSMFCLGPAYQSQFQYETETDLPEGYKRFLFDGKLSGSLIVCYCPKNCDGQLCLDSCPKQNQSYFLQIPHAAMKNEVSVVTTHSVHSTLHSVGGVHMFLPLFSQLDLPHELSDGTTAIDYSIGPELLSVLAVLLETSASAQQQLFQNKGFLVISHMLFKAGIGHRTEALLDSFLQLAKFLLGCPNGIPLLKQLFDYILFNPGFWIHTPAKLQLRLYNYLCTEFVSNHQFVASLRRTSTVLQMLHAVKYYYYVIDPRDRSGYTPKALNGPRPCKNDVVQIRADLLLFIRKIIQKSPDPSPRDEELQALFNYITTVHEDDNLYDVLQCAMSLLSEEPSSMVPAFDRKKGICVIFKLLASPNELIRLPGLKLLGYFLCRATVKRKQDVMAPHNLFTLLTDRLLLNASHLTMPTYNVLYEILTEQMSPQVLYTKHTDPDQNVHFENPMILKVVAKLIHESSECDELTEVKTAFITDMIALCMNDRDNRRVILQMSVWQEWLISMAYVFPETDLQSHVSSMIYRLFSMLLHHAIRLEYGGWRVWVDTLAIVHSKVAWEQFRKQMASNYKAYAERRSDTSSRSRSTPSLTVEDDVSQLVTYLVNTVHNAQDGQVGQVAENKVETQSKKDESSVDGDSPRPIYRTPEFRWSHVHVRLLSDLLQSIEADMHTWKNDPARNLVDHVNDSDNSVFVTNTVHIISQLSDNLIMACGGLLPLLAAATSPNSELEIGDTTQQALPIETAAALLIRFIGLADAMIFTSAISFAELESEKNMPSGGILRQTLRLVATVSVRNILAAKLDMENMSGNDNKHNSKKQSIRRLVHGATKVFQGIQEVVDAIEAASPIQNVDHLVQDMDLHRLKATVYRDVEETRQAQFLALASVYFLSVLMVSRYRDILEPPSSPSPFFNTDSVGMKDDHAQSPAASPVNTTSRMNLTNGTNDSEKKVNGEKKEEDADSAVGSTTNQLDEEEKDPEFRKRPDGKIAAIEIVPQGGSANVEGEYKAAQLEDLRAKKMSVSVPHERQQWLTTRLKQSLDTCAPLLREVMTDFSGFLQRTLLGTHGQEIMTDAKVLATLKNASGSVIELVMLLCSQEWQTSLQKHAGLAFIELVNEGRLMAHATRDHILRVANEADFILNRLRAEDVSKHAEFEAVCAQTALSRREEDRACDHLIEAARRRDHTVAGRINDKIINILTSPHGAWQPSATRKSTFWKLDVWEDDSRRRKRFVPNPYGSIHPEATIKIHNAQSEEGDSGQDDVLSKLGGNNIISPSQIGNGSQSLDEVVDEADMSTWVNEEQLQEEQQQAGSASFMTSCKLICLGLSVPGVLSITSSEVFFDCNEDDPEMQTIDPKILRYCENVHGRWHFGEIRAIFLRRYMLQNCALELFLASRTAIMLAFVDHAVTKKVVQHLPRVGVGVKYGLPQSRRASLMLPRQLFKHSDMPHKWQRREISNFDYLMFLNTIAGRSVNDLNQYPVFPWIISNYESKELDLNQPSNFRDLSKPIGALTANRRAFFDERYNSWEHDSIPAFHYGTHYSTAAFTLNWMLRIEPFTTMFLNLQGGKFDHADRLFHSMNDSWNICQRDSHDVKELIPELYYLPEMMRNDNELGLGKRDSGCNVGDVVLPPWASSPEQFIAIHRQALESDLVSCHLHQWIDLIFGYKQRGPEAVRTTNVFYYLTYEGAVDITTIDDETTRAALENQMKNFGQTPPQLLSEPHAPRQSVMTISPMMFQPMTEELVMIMKFISNSPIVHLSANTYTQLTNPSVVSIAANLGFAINKWNNQFSGTTTTPTPSFPSAGTSESPAAQANMLVSSPGPNIPLTVDPLLATGSPTQPVAKRNLGDSLDQRIEVKSSNFVVSVDSKHIFSCGYPDFSFRIIDAESGRVRQVVYGHRNVVTLLARSECNLFSDCFVASGSLDCTVLLWHWNAKTQLVAGEYNQPGELPSPRAVLTGHDNHITALVVSAEHGLVISASKDGAVLVHTTQGELLRCLTLPEGITNRVPRHLLVSRECLVLCCFGDGHLVLYTTSGKTLNARDTQHHINAICMTRDGEYVVLGGQEAQVQVLRLFDLSLLHQYKPCDNAIRSLAITQNHRFIVAGVSSGAVVVLNVDFNKWHFEYKNRYSN